MKKSNYYTIILVLVGVCTGLLITECFLRIKGDFITTAELESKSYVSPYHPPSNFSNPQYYKFAPDKNYRQCKPEFCYEFISTREGYAYGGFSQTPNQRKILFLGDSFTEGVGARKDSSYPVLLYKKFNSKRSTIEILNAGISGSDLVYEFKLFKDLLLPKKPDIVIVTVNISDINDVAVRGGFERFKVDGSVVYKQAPCFESIYAKSHIARLIVHNFFKCNSLLVPIKNLPALNKANEKVLVAAIDSFNNECIKNNILLLIVFHPTRLEVDGTMPYGEWPLIKHCIDKGIDYVDFMQTLKDYDSAQIANIYWHWDGHFNHIGYETLAQ